MSRPLPRWPAALMLMAASGFAGLAYQIVWTQQGGLWVGHEAAAVLAVVTAFFGGLAVGALAFGPRIARTSRPLAWYTACELAIAIAAAAAALSMPRAGAWLARLPGAQPSPLAQWTVTFAGMFVLLLPATAAMGATLPAMERLLSSSSAPGRGAAGRPNAARAIAALYAANTWGAVLGVVVTAFWAIPALGLRWTALACVALNVACALGARLAFGGGSGAAVVEVPLQAAVVPGASARAALGRLAISGALGIGYEVLVVRVLSQVTESTVYTFATLLALYLVGTAAGAAGYARLAGRRSLGSARRPDSDLGNDLATLTACACLAGAGTLWFADRTLAAVLQALGHAPVAALVAEAAPATLAFALPAVAMGALFSHLAGQAQAAGVSFGRALGANTLAAAGAPLAFGVVALPGLGPKLALVTVGAGYLTLGSRSLWRRPVAWAVVAGAVGLAALAPRLAFVEVPPGGRVVSYRDGVAAAVSVVADADGVERLRINNRAQEGSSASLRVDGRQAWLPLALHPAPRTALFLGLGTGVTAAAAAEDPTLDVEAVELLPEVIAAARRFAAVVPAGAARLRVIAADARRYVRASARQYDVIVSDNFHPARSGSGALYTVEHFQAVGQRLAPGGLFCQWLPLHQLDLQTLRSVVRSFLAVYPRAWAVLASNSLETPVIGLIARPQGPFDVAAVRARLAQAALPARLALLGLDDELAVLGSFIAGPDALRAFARGAELNTDDRPVVAYRAPRATYAPQESPADRLLALLAQVTIAPGELTAAVSEQAWPGRLSAYWRARDSFIRAGRAVRLVPRVQDMLAQVREPLLNVLRVSPDFRPAYDPLLAMATALAPVDPTAARELFIELAQLQPARPEAVAAVAALR